MRRMVSVLLTSSACLFVATNLPAAAADTSSPSSSTATADQAAREELVRRQEAQIAAEKLIARGEGFFYSGKYQEAIGELEQGIKLLPRAPATEVDYNRALHGLTDSYARLADASLHSGDFDKASMLANKALEYDPENGVAKAILKKVREANSEKSATNPTGTSLDATPEFVAKKDEIKKLFREGKILMNSGQYDDADSRFQQILILDPYNADAIALLKTLNKQRMDYAEGAQAETRLHRLWEVSDRWTPPINTSVPPPKVEETSGPIMRDALRQQSIVKKLNDIIIPEVNYREAVVSDVITFLSDESRTLDPDKVGVNIVLSSGVGAAAPKPPTSPGAPPAPAAPGGAEATPTPAPAAAEGAETFGQKITLSLRNVPLIDALKYVTTLAGLKYRVEPSAVIILPLDAPEGELITRSYPVTPGVFQVPGGNALAAAAAANQTPQGAVGAYRAIGGANPVVAQTNDVQDAFRSAGVPFPPGSSLVYNPRTSTIIIRNTPENLEIFERVLAAYNFVPSQIEIEARFVQISQNDLDELGFDWQMGTKTLGSFDVTGGTGAETFPPGSGAASSASYDLSSGLRGANTIQGNAIDALLAANGFGTTTPIGGQLATIRGILTDPQFQLLINALAQKESTDTLSAPKVTTVSGQQAQIRSVQEFIYPTSWAQPTATSAGGGVNGGGAVAVTPSIPSAFQTREVGVLLNVTPEVGADGYTINLTLAPEVSQFLGFINYGSPIGLSAGNNVVTTFNDIKEPLFASENLTTSVVIWDGQTVVLGGLITEQLTQIDDKIPFLGDLPLVGRLFQSKTTQRSKLNLLVFVTARLIDPAGNPVHRLPIATTARF
ncbi:MAG TPA: hypothetical protein VMP11_12505 [Verrucomicrobiae bacterium]|nr:hypothetical protein [Verrucomicrobiae bacterium]